VLELPFRGKSLQKRDLELLIYIYLGDMEEDNGLKNILKWAGIIALIAVPVFLVLRKFRLQEQDSYADDDSNIFASELEE
jgi:hypothetical protein